VGPVGELHLEAIAGGSRGARLDDPEDVGAVGAKPGRDVPDVQPQHSRRVEVSHSRQDAPGSGPVGDVAATHIPRAHDHVRPGVDVPEQFGQRCGIVREVGVHLDDDVVPAAEPVREAGPVRHAEAGLVQLRQYFDLPQFRGDHLGQIRGAIGASVVDDQDVSVSYRGAHLAEDIGDVLGLEVGRDDDQRPHTRAPAVARPAQTARAGDGFMTAGLPRPTMSAKLATLHRRHARARFLRAITVPGRQQRR
jgi:hypothetical protein